MWSLNLLFDLCLLFFLAAALRSYKVGKPQLRSPDFYKPESRSATRPLKGLPNPFFFFFFAAVDNSEIIQKIFIHSYTERVLAIHLVVLPQVYFLNAQMEILTSESLGFFLSVIFASRKSINFAVHYESPEGTWGLSKKAISKSLYRIVQSVLTDK